MIRPKQPIIFFIYFFLLQGICLPLFPQDSTAILISKFINPGELKAHVYILSSDSLEGRETGEAGQKKAAKYISNFYRSLGLLPPVNGEVPSYLQSFIIERETTVTGEIIARGKKYIFPDDFVSLADGGPRSVKKHVEVVFAGHGDSTDYRGLDVRNKAVMIFFSGDRNARRNKVRIGQNHGATDFIFLYTRDKASFTDWVTGYKNILEGPVEKLPENSDLATISSVLYMAPETGAEILGVRLSRLEKCMEKNDNSAKNNYRKIRHGMMSLDVVVSIEEITTENVAGLLVGSEHPEEIIVVSAHYDHLGMDSASIYHGADDNASGTAAILELARVFSKAKESGDGPRRSILFLAFTGEEKGLMGSEYYARNPIFPLENTIADFNIDMIGRIDRKHFGNPAYIYLIGSDRISKELHVISEHCNELYSNLELDYTYNDTNDPRRFYYRSDHYNFARNNIPVIFYFSGDHEDYHTPGDTADKIDYDKMSAIVKLVFHTVWEVSNMNKRLDIDRK